MIKIFFILIILPFSTIAVLAQKKLPTVYEIETDTAVDIKLDNAYWQILEDRGGKWTIDEVSSNPIADKFHTNTTKANGILEVDYSIHTFWLRYRLKNNMTHEARITIPKNVTYAHLYTPDSTGKWNHKLTGTAAPWSKRDDLKRITAINYIIQPGEELLIYERNNFDYLINLPDFLEVRFGFTDKVIKSYYDGNDPSILSSFVFGIFLLAGLFNLYFFLIVRGRVYLFFSLTLLFNGFMRFLFSNDVFFRENPMVKWYFAQGCGLLFFFSLIHFVRYYFETFKHFPRWDKYLTGLSIYFVFYFILQEKGLIPVKYGDITGPGIVLLSILLTFIMFLRSHVTGVRLSIVAALPVICIMIIPSLVNLFKFLNENTGIAIPSFMKWIWVNNRFPLFEQIGLVWLLIFFSWSLFRRYQQLQEQITQETLAKERLAKEKQIERNQLIAQQKVELEKEVDERTSELKQSLEKLQTSQSQLIHQEKMASLGELTAGIAHEIQNPVNFINNFSEVNTELIAELKDEMDKGNLDNAKTIANDVSENEQKINHHGKRADAIVKGMLQHSRKSSGVKEPTDINALVDEYLRLAYHGLRAKDNSFNATVRTDYDTSLGQISIIRQDIGRVLLNLYNNAFYAVSEKKRTSQLLEGGVGYEPTVSISTMLLTPPSGVWGVEIKVTDNGNGIPQKTIDKIFQPFFTTKPTGQGTGLGLSLSYDITKAHGGDIKVETKEGEFTRFIIQLPS